MVFLCCSKVVLVGVALGGRPAHVLDAGVGAAAPWVVRVRVQMMPLRRLLLHVGGMVLVLVLLLVVLLRRRRLVVRVLLLQRRRHVRVLLEGLRRRSVPRRGHRGRPCGGPGGNDDAAARRPRGLSGVPAARVRRGWQVLLLLRVLEGVVGVMVRMGRVMLLGWTSSTCRLPVRDRRHHVQRVVRLLRLLLRPVVMLLLVVVCGGGGRGRAKVGLRVVRRRARLVRMVRVLAMVSRCRCGRAL
jgi:hypothetical protein